MEESNFTDFCYASLGLLKAADYIYFENIGMDFTADICI